MSKKQKAIASIINTLMVATDMQKKGTFDRWYKTEQVNTVLLGKYFKIELPCYNQMLDSLLLNMGQDELDYQLKMEYELVMAYVK